MAEFTQALVVPAFISTVRKIQHDSDEALRVLAAYKKRYECGQRELGTADEAALEDILANVARQGADAVLFFLFAVLAVKSGGALAGQSAQALISINYMTAPKKQFLKPREWLMDALPIPQVLRGRSVLRMLPQDLKQSLALSLGGIAKITGYEPRLATST